MSLKFTKMHGLGNDFMVVDGVNQNVELTPKKIAALADRHLGVGFDQLLLVESPKHADFDFYYRIYNADGQEVGQCGNGARCLARFVNHYNLTTKKTIRVETHTTEMQLTLHNNHQVTVDFGIPTFSPKAIPIHETDIKPRYELTFAHHASVHVHAVNVGNPHAVLKVDAIDSAPIDALGKAIATHPLFPEQTNAGFMCIHAPNQMSLRVYERGCGETQACGSGAVAAAVVGRLFYEMAPRIHVTLLGGTLCIDWPDTEGPVFLTGSADFVYEGVLLCE